MLPIEAMPLLQKTNDELKEKAVNLDDLSSQME